MSEHLNKQTPSASTRVVGCDKQNHGLCHFSRDGKLVALAHHNRLCIRDSSSFEIVRMFSCVEAIEQLQWSPDSQLVLCSLGKLSAVQVWAVHHPTWRCKVTEGVAGLVYACWAPTSRHIITIADFQLHATVWSLADEAQVIIKNPKLAASGIAFSPDKQFMAMLHREDCKDRVSVYWCRDWTVVANFRVDSVDAEQIVWASGYLLIRDTPLEYSLLVYSPKGDKISQFCAYENALGIKTMMVAPVGIGLVALGSFDSSLRLFNLLTQRCCATFEHTGVVPGRDDGSTIVLREVLTGDDALVAAAAAGTGLNGNGSNANASSMPGKRRRGGGGSMGVSRGGVKSRISNPNSRSGAINNENQQQQHQHVGGGGQHGGNSMMQSASSSSSSSFSEETAVEIQRKSIRGGWQLTVISPEYNKALPRMGVGLVAWSPDGSMLASRNDNMPHALWVWNVGSIAPLCVVEFRGKVLSLRWEPSVTGQQARVAVVTGKAKVFMCYPELKRVEVADLTSSTGGDQGVSSLSQAWDARGMRWAPNGNGGLVVLSRTQAAMVSCQGAGRNSLTSDVAGDESNGSFGDLNLNAGEKKNKNSDEDSVELAMAGLAALGLESDNNNNSKNDDDPVEQVLKRQQMV